MEIFFNPDIEHLDQELSRQELTRIILSWKDAEQQEKSGRGRVVRFKSAELNLVLRKFYRGGMIKLLSRDNFLNLSFLSFKNRAEQEFEILKKLFSAKISVPKPVAYIYLPKGKMFYQAFLLTEEIPQASNLLEIINLKPQEQINSICYKAGVVAKQILDACVFHPDIHLGNILFDKEERVFIIDFDKAFEINPRRKDKYKLKILKRWLNSCLKHKKEKLAWQPFNEGFLA